MAYENTACLFIATCENEAKIKEEEKVRVFSRKKRRFVAFLFYSRSQEQQQMQQILKKDKKRDSEAFIMRVNV